MYAVTEALGLLASLTSFILWIPQGVRVWRARRDPAALSGIAVSTQVISLVGNVLWFVYALLIQSFWLGAPIVVNLPVLLMTIAVLVRARRMAAVPTTATPPPPSDTAAPTTAIADPFAGTPPESGAGVTLAA